LLLVIDVSVHSISPIFKGQAVQEERTKILNALNLLLLGYVSFLSST